MLTDFGSHYVTDQVIAQSRIIRDLDDVPMRTQGERLLKDMLAKMDAGVANVPQWALDRIQKIDSCLRLRWDYDFGTWMLDRYVTQLKCHMTVCTVGPDLNSDVITWLCEQLKAGDMQRYASPEDYHKAKQEKAAHVREVNQKKGDEKVLAAVDSLSDERIKNFIQVERACRTGERIRPLGADADSMNRMMEAGKTAPAPPSADDAMNPGMRPDRHQHKPRTL